MRPRANKFCARGGLEAAGERAVVAVGVGDDDIGDALAFGRLHERRQVSVAVRAGVDDGDLASPNDVAACPGEGERRGLGATRRRISGVKAMTRQRAGPRARAPKQSHPSIPSSAKARRGLVLLRPPDYTHSTIERYVGAERGGGDALIRERLRNLAREAEPASASRKLPARRRRRRFSARSRWRRRRNGKSVLSRADDVADARRSHPRGVLRRAARFGDGRALPRRRIFRACRYSPAGPRVPAFSRPDRRLPLRLPRRGGAGRLSRRPRLTRSLLGLIVAMASAMS